MEKFICIIYTSAGYVAHQKLQPRSTRWMNSSFPMPISTHCFPFPPSVGSYPTYPTNGRTASTGRSKYCLFPKDSPLLRVRVFESRIWDY